jgi:glyoxylase-like metal-dependent hydrolase (beta-lactamase superfamily II)
VHADHLSAAPYIREQLGGRIGICSAVTVVQKTFSRVFNSGPGFLCDGSDFDVLLDDGDDISIGSLTGYAMHTPGHTPACMSFVYGGAVFIGDTLFMPDGGTARADFPGGDAAVLYQSIRRILALPESTRLYVCHDYCPNGRSVEYQTTVGDQLRHNIHVGASVVQNDFVEMREQRDAGLEMPTLILPSLQVNMRAGRLPEPEPTGQVFLKLPINAFAGDKA